MFFISHTASAIEVKSIVDKLNQIPAKSFISKQVVFDDQELDDEAHVSGKYRLQVTFISNGTFYTIWDYDSYVGNDILLVSYVPVSVVNQKYSSVFSLDEVTGEIIDIMEAKDGGNTIYANYSETTIKKQNTKQIVKKHLNNIKAFLKM
ncbi:MAG: hypothetical protein Q8S84_01840 [bacterium]|nr:hypothetical protein [bacterium]MDP3380301.1 hypothetical protein [bacterium]